MLPRKMTVRPIPPVGNPCCNRVLFGLVPALVKAMRRRDFIKGIASSTATWPMTAGAQPSPMPVVGFLRDSRAAGSGHIFNGLRKGLAEAGLDEGRNLTIDFALTDDQSERLPALAAELVQRHVSVIVSSAINATVAAKAATTTIPIVFAINNDPVEFGLVASLSHPGGNLTGISYLSSALGAKRLGLMHEMLPKVTDFAVLAHPNYVASTVFISDVEAAASSLGLRIKVFHASTESEIDGAFADMSTQKVGALLMANHTLFTTRRDHIIALAARYAIPTMYVQPEFADAGGLIAYGTSVPDVYRLAGNYAGRILKGEKPAELPVLLPTTFELVINLRTAKELKFDIPPTLLARADEVIE
jgi:putative tryptophan/tyrosine transport system substrate-binding protein